MDACSKRRHVPWLLVRAMESHVGWVGPLFIPDQTACYRSLDARLRGNLSFFGEHQAFEQHLRDTHAASAPCGGLHAFLDLIASAAVVESIKFVCDLSVPHLAGRFITINLSNWDVEAHEVLRVPRVGLEGAEPRLFAWKEMPHEDIAGHKEGIFARRS
jgi:bacteriocin biosynthesis cyclodehydratase domain-containing protein